MKELDIKWLQEYAEQEKRYKWGEQIKLLLTAYEKEKEKNKNARYYIIDRLNNDDIINTGIDDMKIILDMLEE